MKILKGICVKKMDYTSSLKMRDVNFINLGFFHLFQLINPKEKRYVQ